MSEIKLSEEEIKLLSQHKVDLENIKHDIGNLRLQYLTSEQELLQQVKVAENNFLTYLKMLAQSKNVPENGEWVFDPINFSFRKKI